jgi:Tse2 ADP-ribosyltransferase toxins
METDSNGVEWVRAGGGTSLFDRPNVFVRDGWLSFKIPGGTPVPEPLAVNKGEYNKRFKAWHYQIEVRTGRTQKTVMQGALDNFARSALARFVEQSKAQQS